MLWHKPLTSFFGVVPFGTFSLIDIRLDGDVANIEMGQDLGAGDPLRFAYRVSRGGRLVGFTIHYRDGTTLRAVPAKARSR